jgi:hypothetical protein
MPLTHKEQHDLQQQKHIYALELIEKKTIFAEREHQLKMERINALKEVSKKLMEMV